MKIYVFRRYRGAWFSWEWHSFGGVRYLMVSVSNPYRHAWWATQLFFYL